MPKKLINGHTYVTLSEALSATPALITLPTCLTELSQGTGNTAITMADALTAFYADAYLCLHDLTKWQAFANASSKIIVQHFKQKITNLNTLISDFIADAETETVEAKRAANGSVSFASAFSDGGTIRNKSGGSSGDVNRLMAYQNELRDTFDECLHVLGKRLFLGVLDPVGCGV